MTPEDLDEIRKLIRSELYSFGKNVLGMALGVCLGMLIYQIAKHLLF